MTIRREVLEAASEVCAARAEGHYPSPLEALELLEPTKILGRSVGGEANDPEGRAALVALCYPNTISPDEADTLGLPELSEAARLSALASMTLDDGDE